MSEYQFYEFAAVDCPVSEQGLAYARSVSSRAEITRRRWRNVYNWGDFRGSVDKMLEYYDSHLYFTNWGTFRFVLVFPEDLLPLCDIRPYLTDDCLTAYSRAGRTVVEWVLQEDEPGWEWEDGGGILDSVLPVRGELLLGDRRSLYIGWLAWASQWGDVVVTEGDSPESEPEPPVPPGLAELTPAQAELADRLGVDPDLLRAAAEADIPVPDRAASLRAAVEALPPGEMTAYLLRVACGEGVRVSVELNRLADTGSPTGGPPRRTLGALLESARRHREDRLRLEAEEEERQRREQEAKQKVHLAAVMERADAVWSAAEGLATRRTAAAYAEAATMLRELRDAYALAGREKDFRRKLDDFRERYAGRPALLRRIAEL